MTDSLIHGDDPEGALPTTPRTAASESTPKVRWDAGPRIVCLLTTLHPERHLALAVRNYLGQEMPDIEFTLHPRPDVDAIWICGHEPGTGDLIQQVRDENPRALIVVTGRAPLEDWRQEVLDAGADHACGWPIPYADLSRLFHRRGTPAIA